MGEKCQTCGDPATQWDYDQLMYFCDRHVQQADLTVPIESRQHAAHAIDVPSIMFGNGVDRGVVAERARVVKWLREQGRYSNPHNLDDVADAIERGDHVSSAR